MFQIIIYIFAVIGFITTLAIIILAIAARSLTTKESNQIDSTNDY